MGYLLIRTGRHAPRAKRGSTRSERCDKLDTAAAARPRACNRAGLIWQFEPSRTSHRVATRRRNVRAIRLAQTTSARTKSPGGKPGASVIREFSAALSSSWTQSGDHGNFQVKPARTTSTESGAL